MNNKYVFFWGTIYSQWYKANMTLDFIDYTSCEQYMMHQKALLFGDTETADKILKTNDPKKQKQLGREVKNFDAVKWNSECFSIVYRGNYAKFSQNEDLKSELLKTGTKILVEASPEDKIWGVGLAENDWGINDPVNWQGFNLLGWAITLVKHELMNGVH